MARNGSSVDLPLLASSSTGASQSLSLDEVPLLDAVSLVLTAHRRTVEELKLHLRRHDVFFDPAETSHPSLVLPLIRHLLRADCYHLSSPSAGCLRSRE